MEKEFSKLRQGSGEAYFFSVQQALSRAEVRKTKLSLDLTSGILYPLNKCNGHKCFKFSFTPNANLCELIDKLPQIEDDLME